jgi:hypothetical protein
MYCSALCGGYKVYFVRIRLFIAVVCSVTPMVWGRYKFETRCDNYSRCIGSVSNVCLDIDE